MLFKKIIDRKHYSFQKEAADWRTAIRMSCEPLLADQTIDPAYVDQLIANVEKFGPYIVIAPGVAMPHASEAPEAVHATAISFMKLEKPVSFDDEDPDKLCDVFFTLCATSGDEHMENMSNLAEVLTDDELLEKLHKVEKPEELLELDQ